MTILFESIFNEDPELDFVAPPYCWGLVYVRKGNTCRVEDIPKGSKVCVAPSEMEMRLLHPAAVE